MPVFLEEREFLYNTEWSLRAKKSIRPLVLIQMPDRRMQEQI